MKRPLLLILLLGIALLACSSQNEEQPRVGNPVVRVTVDSLGSKLARFKVELINADKAWLLAKTGRADTPSASALKEEGHSFPSGMAVYDNLEPDTEYTLFYCAEGERLGSVDKLTFKTLSGELYSWEKDRTGVPFFADLALLYGGLSGRKPAVWDEDRLKAFVTWTDPETGQEKWLFDAFLALEMRYGYPPHTYGIGLMDWEDKSLGMIAANQADASAFLDYWFTPGTGFPALDKLVGEAIGRIGPPVASIKVIVMMPDISVHERYNVPSSSTTYWGKVDDRQLDFSNAEDRRQAYYWYVDETRRRFSEAGFENIELGGFYIMSEELPSWRSGVGGNGGDYINGTLYDGWEVAAKAWDDVFPAVSDYIHQFNESVCWIPYRNAAGYRYWSEFGIDYAWMQPNYYWDTFGVNPISTFFPKIATYNLAMELEFDDLMMQKPVDRSASEYTKERGGVTKTETYQDYAKRWRAYLDGAKNAMVYGHKQLALYQDTDSFNHLHNSSAKADKDAFNTLCKMIAEDPLKAKNK